MQYIIEEKVLATSVIQLTYIRYPTYNSTICKMAEVIHFQYDSLNNDGNTFCPLSQLWII